MADERVVVIGLDAGDWNIIDPLIAKGKLPNFQRFKEEGAWGYLRSNVPPITVPAWASIFSGYDTHQLGTFGFFPRDGNDLRKSKLVDSKIWQGKSIFDQLGDEKRSLAINIPGTYPPWEINGVMIGGMLSPEPTTYPKSYKKKLDNYIVEGHYDKAEEAFHRRMENFYNIIGEEDFDLITMVLRYPDSINHTTHRNPIKYFEKCYRQIDEELGKILEKFKDDYVFLISDHGTEVYTKMFYVNRWLQRKGWAKNPAPEGNKLVTYGKVIVDNLGLAAVKKFLHKIWSKVKGGGTETKDPVEVHPDSQAFGKKDLSRWGHIFLLDESIKDEVKAEISKEKFIEEVYETEDIFGSRPENFPHIIFRCHEGWTVHASYDYPFVTSRIPKTFHHSDYGIFGVIGPEIEKGEVDSISNKDVSPTIVHLFGSEIPEDVSGIIKKEIFKSDSEIKKRNERYSRKEQGLVSGIEV